MDLMYNNMTNSLFAVDEHIFNNSEYIFSVGEYKNALGEYSLAYYFSENIS